MNKKLFLTIALLTGTTSLFTMEAPAAAVPVEQPVRLQDNNNIMDKIGLMLVVATGCDIAKKIIGPMSLTETIGVATSAGLSGYAAHRVYQMLSNKNKIRVLTASGIGLSVGSASLVLVPLRGHKHQQFAAMYVQKKIESALADYLQANNADTPYALQGLNGIFYSKSLVSLTLARELFMANNYEQGVEILKLIPYAAVTFPGMEQHIMSWVVLPTAAILSTLQDQGLVGYDEDGMRLGRR